MGKKKKAKAKKSKKKKSKDKGKEKGKRKKKRKRVIVYPECEGTGEIDAHQRHNSLKRRKINNVSQRRRRCSSLSGLNSLTSLFGDGGGAADTGRQTKPKPKPPPKRKKPLLR